MARRKTPHPPRRRGHPSPATPLVRVPRRRRPHPDRPAGAGHLLQEQLRAWLHLHPGPQTVQEIAAGLATPPAARKALADLLVELEKDGVLVRSGPRRFILRPDPGLVEATVSMHPRGFAFALLDDRKKDKTDDPFIHPKNLHGASHGDRVLVRIEKGRQGRGPEARVFGILNHAATRVAGIFHAGGTVGVVVPEDPRISFHVTVSREKNCGARHGEAVVALVESFTPDRQNHPGRIVAVLGDPADLRVQVRLVAEGAGLPQAFSDAALRQADAFPRPTDMPPDPARADLRPLVHVTIDGEDARDFDDAVSLARDKKGGFVLHVSIADVGAYVEAGSPLDLEAYDRGTSVYFPGTVIPMLPERLSNDLCSLVPDEDRLAFSAILGFNKNGSCTASRFTKSLIRSKARLTYTAVAAILVDGDKELRQRHEKLLPMLVDMAQLAELLKKNRMDRGSIGFALPEAKTILDADGQVLDIRHAERNLAHEIIEEFMLAANEAVARHLAAGDRGAIYRIHDAPDPAKVTEFVRYARAMGLAAGGEPDAPAWFARILEHVAGTPRQYVINNLLLRTMQQARYAVANNGHFGLAATHYTHFTSPIRRYPDLIVHRLLAGLLPETAAPAPLEIAADFLSGRERRATEAGWAMDARIRARFMAGRLGEEFDAIVSGVSDRGLFVELVDHFVSGMVGIENLGFGYQIDPLRLSLSNSKSGRRFQIGDPLRVLALDVDLARQQVNFGIAPAKET